MSGDGHKAQSISGMDCKDYKVLIGFSEKAYNIFLDFMTRVAEFEELVNVGGRFLSTYKSELELFRRPPLQMKTTVIKEIMEANNSGWMRSYIEAGCRHQHTDIDNINKLNMCQQGIHEHIVKATTLLDELGCLMENVLVLVKEEIEKLSHYMDELQDDGLVYPLIRAEEEPENINQYHQNTSVSECATMMQAVYGMLEDDYVMQEKIVSSLNLSTPSEALESYCFMWDLRPFVDNDIIRAAWRHVK
ncbi:uncharacterized protein LOC116264394 isoform X1 [Nymphaea colorata]|uniref:uncharacterized protein LOC116264394 isoform X1 n=1 Tax=Nymphaea colorata TaxID=210225 RepID=UPI00129D2572|nr:uncharacterized protein LOC116264394 isoform X1 [Nymphaea colorata]XP_031500439.1 uncharacterized protein LOC116264394 isoform X1 [Nymphaea colorata]